MQHHHYSLSDLDHMMPWEREIYLILIAQYLEQVELEKKRLRDNAR